MNERVPFLNDDYSVAYRDVVTAGDGLSMGEVTFSLPLKSVDAHNAEVKAKAKEIMDKASRTGVACPKCGDELCWRDRWQMADRLKIANRGWIENYDDVGLRPARCRRCEIVVDLFTLF